MFMKNPQGFTLIELSIVLVIISLIVGGVIGGKSLIHAAKLNQQIVQLNEYKVAYNNFLLQYNAIPGDFREATSYWPSGGTANGDGDGRIESSGGVTDVSNSHFNAELPLFFEHLSLAGLVSQNYDGSSEIDKGYPSLVIDDGAGMIAGMRNAYEVTSCAKLGVKLYLQIGLPDEMPHMGYADNRTILSAREGKMIDRKLDDGIATTGKFCSWNGSSATGDCQNNGTYNVSVNTFACRSSYRL